MPDAPANVLFVTREMAGDRRYGIGRSLMPIVEVLQARGWRVRYLCQEDLPMKARTRQYRWSEWLRGFPGVRKSASRQQLVCALFERLHMGWFAARVTQADRYSVVHLHDPWLACGFYLGARLLRLPSIRWGLTEHGFGSYSRATHDDGLLQGATAQRWLRRWESWILSKAHFVTAPTKLALQQLARDLCLPCVSPSWRSIPHASPVRPAWQRDTARQHLGWGAHDLVVLGVGRLVALKRFDLLVDACAQLMGEHPNLRLVLLGDGDAEGLLAHAASVGMDGRVRCESVNDVWPYYAAADVYVSTSTTESFGLANLEALHAGLACICTAVGGVPEVLGAGAWLVPVDLHAVRSALEVLIKDPSQRLHWSVRAQRQSGESPDLASIVEAYATLYAA